MRWCPCHVPTRGAHSAGGLGEVWEGVAGSGATVETDDEVRKDELNWGLGDGRDSPRCVAPGFPLCVMTRTLATARRTAAVSASRARCRRHHGGRGGWPPTSLYSGGGGGGFVCRLRPRRRFFLACRGARRGFPGRHLPERLGHAIAPVYVANWCRGRWDSVEASPRMAIPAICIRLMHPSISRSGSVVRGTAESSRRRTLPPWRAGSGASRHQGDTAVSR